MKKTFLYFIFCILIASCQQNSNVNLLSLDTILETDSSSTLIHKIDSVSDLISYDTLNAALYFDRAALYMKNEALDMGASDLKRAVQLDSTIAKAFAEDSSRNSAISLV